MVRTPGRHDDVIADFHGRVVADFRFGIGQCEDDGIFGHPGNHGRLDQPAFAQSQEYVGTVHGRLERIEPAIVGVPLLGGIKPFAPGVDVAFAVEHVHLVGGHAQLFVQVQTAHGRGSSAADNDADVLNGFLSQFQGIQQGSSRNDGRSVLVVMHDGNVQFGLQAAFNFKCLRGFDVFQVDAAKRRCNGLDGGDELLRIARVHFNVKHIDVGEYFKQHALPFHHRLARLGANVAQPEHRGAVGDHRDQIAFGCVVVDVLLVSCNGFAGLRHPRTVGQSEVLLRAVRLRGEDFNLPLSASAVVIERFAFA